MKQKTAIDTVLEKLRAKQAELGTLYPMFGLMLIEAKPLERGQIEDSFAAGGLYAAEAIYKSRKDIDSNKAFNDYFTQTYEI